MLEFALLPSTANASNAARGETVVERGEEVQARVAEQAARLTGAADPDSVPVADSGQAAPADPAAASAGRRLQAFRAGGFKIGSSRPATRPTSKPPTGGSSSKPAAKPTRPYFPAGGTARPRYSMPAAALSSLPFAATQRPYLASRFFYGRPVYGFGR